MNLSSAVDDAKAAIADLVGVLARVDDDSRALREAITRFDHATVLERALRLERTVDAVKEAEQFVVGAVARTVAEGCREAVAADLDALRAHAAHVMQFQRNTAVLLEKARGFNRAHQQALLPPTQSYGRRARFVDGAVASSLRTAG